MAPTMIITSSTVTSDDTSKDGTIAMEFTSNESTSNFVVEDITAVSGTLQISKIKIIPADSSGNPSYHGGHWNLGHIDLLDANGNNLITQSSNGISVTATASQSNWGHVENLIAPSINDQKTWGGTSGTMGDHYYVGLTRNTDVTITLPSGTQIAEVILTPWMKYSYWQRTMNVIVELYNDNNVMLSSSFIPAYTNNTPYTGPGSDYGPAAYIFSNDSEISSDINNVLATIPAAISLTDSNGNYRTVVFVPPLSSRFAGSLSNFSGSGTTYNAIFTPSGDATYTINVAANTFTDTTGNSNSASNNFLWTYDTLAPTVSSFTMADTVLKAGETSLVTLTFSEAVTEFSNADITVVNGSLTTMESVNGGITWTGTYTPSVDTTSTTNVLTLATAYTDVAGNVGPSASTDYFAIDTLAPTVSSFTMSDTALKRGDTATVTLVFSEAVTSFSSDADITVQNGSLASMTTLNNITWVGTFTPTINIEDASNILTLATSYTDTAGNAGPVATAANYTIDTTSPTVSSFTMSDTALKAGEVATVTLVFSEAVSGFSSNDDITVQNGSLSTMTTSNNITWVGTFTPTINIEDASNILTLETSYTDTTGNAGPVATTANYTIDTTSPTVSSFTMSDTALKAGEVATVTLVFSETVSGFSSNDDITVQNGSLSTMTTSDNITWVGTFTPTIDIEDATNILTLAASYTDTAGNAGPVSTTANYRIDITSPTVSSFTMSDTLLEFNETATVTLVFSEAVSGFSSNDDITVQNGSLSIMTTSDNITWTGIFTSTANTQDTENVLTLAASYTDTVGNTGISATTATYIINNICFPKGTPVTTDQGNITIDSLNTDLHTIKGNNIVGITQCQPIQKYIVCIEKDSLSKNVPSQQTLISKEHNIYYQGEMIKAKDLVDLCENVYLVNYNGETLYNVLLKQHDTMMVNNLICETLDPENIVAKISQIKDKSKKDRIVKKLNKIMIKNNILEYQKVYDSL